jgi:hypothetical protein
LGLKPRTGSSSPKTKLLAKHAVGSSRFAALRGARQTGKSTDEIINELRGYADDARDPGIAAVKNHKS